MPQTNDICESVEATERFIQTSHEACYPDEMVKRVTHNIRNRADASAKEAHRLLDLIDDVVGATKTADNSAFCNSTYSLDILKIHTSVQMCIDAVENLLVSVNLMKENAAAIRSSVDNSGFTKSSTESLNSAINDGDNFSNDEGFSTRGCSLKKEADGESAATKLGKGPVMRARNKTSTLSLINSSSSPKDKSVAHKNLQLGSGEKKRKSLHLENNGTNADEMFCSCQSASYGNMIMCDSPNCKPKWFHFKCVQLKSAPKGKWLCPGCTSQGTHCERRVQVNVDKKTSSVSTSMSQVKLSSLKGKQKRQPSFRRQIAVSSPEKKAISKFGREKSSPKSKSKKILNATKNGMPNIIQESLGCNSRKTITSSGIQQETGEIDNNHSSHVGEPANEESIIGVCN